MDNRAEITKEQLHFAVFCVESLADDLGLAGDLVYTMLSEDTDILDSYIIPHYDALHTQGKEYIVEELKTLMRKEGVSI